MTPALKATQIEVFDSRMSPAMPVVIQTKKTTLFVWSEFHSSLAPEIEEELRSSDVFCVFSCRMCTYH